MIEVDPLTRIFHGSIILAVCEVRSFRRDDFGVFFAVVV